MAFLLAIPAGLFVLNEVGDAVADKLASAASSVHSFGVALKRKVWDKKKPQEEHKEYSEEYQRIKKKYQPTRNRFSAD